jgi:hypothetical protein
MPDMPKDIEKEEDLEVAEEMKENTLDSILDN